MTEKSKWRQFLKEAASSNKTSMHLLQEFAGYCLLPDNRYRKFLLLTGEGLGKSTFVRILREICHPDYCSSVNISDLDSCFSRAELLRKRLNVSCEFSPDAFRKSKWLEAVIAGESISAAFKHQDDFSFRPDCKIVLVTQLTRKRDLFPEILNRTIYIRFTNRPKEPNPDLFYELKKELPDIFHWAVQGLLRLLKMTDSRFTTIQKPIILTDPSPKSSSTIFRGMDR